MSAGGNRRRGALVAVTGVVALVVGLLVVAGLQGSLVYYRTPTEVLESPPAPTEHFRLGGTVVPGSLRENGARTTFRLTDGRNDIAVIQYGAPPRMFAEGRDAVVDGVLNAGGVFESDTVMVKHSNEYRAREGGR